MDGRAARGRVLAQAHGERIKEIEPGTWFVPSSKGGGYLVVSGVCGCPDHRADVRCKHIVAVEIVQAALAKVDPPAVALAPAKPMQPTGDLTPAEQANVRAALRFLRTKVGDWKRLAQALRAKANTLRNMGSSRPPTAGVAVRLARLAGVPVDDLIAGRWPPPGTCPHCGRSSQAPSPPP